jgi:NAD(P)-dependent dehydrogenase (short-subunit alcohol dehydrogenase family)
MAHSNKNTSLARVALYGAAGATAYFVAKSLYQEYNKFDLMGKVVLITGGSRGLGLVLARQLSEKGARLAICARTAEHLEKAESELKEVGAEVISITADVTDRKQVQKTVQQVLDHYGQLDVLINNAGIIQVGPQEALTVEDYERAMNTNFWSALYCTLAVIPHFKRQSGGRIVNVTSIGGKIAIPHLLPYTVSKFALVGLSEGMHAELKKHKIKVTTVVPNLMRTGSPRNITVKGKHKLEYAWFKITDSSPLLSQSTESAAAQIMNAIEYGKAEVVLSGMGKAATFIQAVAPGFVTSFMTFLNRLLPNARKDSTESKTGYESESFVSRNLARGTNVAALKNNEF